MYPAGWFHGGRRSIRGIVGKEFGLETMIPRGLERGEGGKSPAGHLLAFPRIRAQKRCILSSVRGAAGFRPTVPAQPCSHGAAGGGIIPIPSRGMTGSGVMAG